MIHGFSKKIISRDLLFLGLLLTLAILPSGCLRHHHHRDREVRPTRASLIIQKTAAYQDWAAVRSQMKRDCNVEAQVPAMVRKFTEGKYDNVLLYDIIPPDTVATVLTMTIKDAKGMTGGVYSGAKYLTVEGTVKQDGRVLGTFVDRRASGFGHIKVRPAFVQGFVSVKGTGPGASTCQLLFQCAETIGEDVAEWLQKPVMNAQLGTAGQPLEKEGQSTNTPGREPDKQ